MERLPPTPRPNNDRWLIRPKVPGSRKAARCKTGISSLTRLGSSLAAPRKVTPRVATKKNRWIFGGWPGSDCGPVSLDHRYRISDSMSPAMSAVVSRL